MSIKRLTINGLRGFSEKTNIHFAIPDKINPGSGLTVMVGPNNSGKSTIIEAMHLLSSNVNIIQISSRNVRTNGKVLIEAEDIIGNISSLQSTDNNGGPQNRENYKGNISNSNYRSENNINNNFGGRLLEIYNRRKVFDRWIY